MLTNQPPLNELPISDIYALQETLAAEAAALKTQQAALKAEFTRRWGDVLTQQLATTLKSTTNLEDMGFQIKGEIDKTVSWDSKKLMDLAATMPFADVLAFFKIKFELPEATYKALLPSDPKKAAIDAARTVKYGDIKVTLSKKDAG